MKIIVGTHVHRRDGEKPRSNEVEVDLPDGAVVTGLEFVEPYVVVQYWRPKE